MSADSIIYGIGTFLGIYGCITLHRASWRVERRKRLLSSTRATRLLDGDRFPAAREDYDD